MRSTIKVVQHLLQLFLSHHRSWNSRQKTQSCYIPWTYVAQWLCWNVLLCILINHTIIIASVLPLESPTSRHCSEYDEAPERFRAMEYDETDKWLSLHVLQVMAVPTWSHLNSLPRIQSKFFGDSKAHTRGVYPPKGGHTRRLCITFMGYKSKDGRSFMPTTTLHSTSRFNNTRNISTLPHMIPMAWSNRV